MQYARHVTFRLARHVLVVSWRDATRVPVIWAYVNNKCIYCTVFMSLWDSVRKSSWRLCTCLCSTVWAVSCCWIAWNSLVVAFCFSTTSAWVNQCSLNVRCWWMWLTAMMCKVDSHAWFTNIVVLCLDLLSCSRITCWWSISDSYLHHTGTGLCRASPLEVKFIGSQDGRCTLHLEKQVMVEIGVGFRKQMITNKLETIVIIFTNHCSVPH